MKLLFVQFGDYREAYYRLSSGDEETYYAQKFTVDWVTKKAQEIEYVGVCCIHTQNYFETLPNKVHTFGMNCIKDGPDELIKLLNRESPTHLICCTPYRPLLRWAVKSTARSLPLLADSFNSSGLRSWLRNLLLQKLLNKFEWIGNHNLNASYSLQKIGVDPHKIIPWDFPSFITPDDYKLKKLSVPLDKIRLVYIGNLIESKGVADAILAVKFLIDEGYSMKLTLAGPSDSTPFIEKSKKLGIESAIHFLGRVPHRQALELMRQADIVLVPSWHEYPEGFPLTIYESFCTRTPLVASDHPMFNGKVIHGKTGIIFKAKDSKDLAKKIKELVSNPTLYNEISQNTAAGWKNLQITTKWDEFLSRWLRNSQEDQDWLSERFLYKHLNSLHSVF
jgi:glycosyltransferase involved in cell wall biosynthesis